MKPTSCCSGSDYDYGILYIYMNIYVLQRLSTIGYNHIFGYLKLMV